MSAKNHVFVTSFSFISFFLNYLNLGEIFIAESVKMGINVCTESLKVSKTKKT